MTKSGERGKTSNGDIKIEFIECAYLCPDDRHKEFEYGAYCIANIAKKGASIRQLNKAPSKVKDELERFYSRLEALSLDAAISLRRACGSRGVFDGPVDRMKRIARRAIDGVEEGRDKYDKIRGELGLSAAAIWKAHDGDLSKEQFIQFVELLIAEAGFDGGDKKSRIGSVSLVKDIRECVAKHGAPTWDLWGS